MYQQPQGSYNSSDSLRRLSSNNPFRQQPFSQPQHANPSSGSVRSSNAAFDDWVERNKKIIESSDEDEEVNADTIVNFYGSSISPTKPDHDELARPKFPPKPVRTGSDSTVNYVPRSERKMSSNNPFAAAMNEPNSYVHHRDPPPPPGASAANRPRTQTPPSRPPKVAPPSYEEAAGPEVSRSNEYPREKESGVRVSSRETTNNNNSHSNSNSHSRLSNRDSGSREHSSRDGKPRRTRSANDHESSSRPHRSHRLSADREKDKERRRRKSPSKKTPQPVKSKNLDTIDKLDVTAFFGGGFHHDGPFDACTPQRNKNVKAAPVMAFPADGPNNSIKGAAKDKHLHIDMAFGNSDLDQNEIIGRSAAARANGRGSVSHGQQREINNEVPSIALEDQTSSLYIPKHNPSVINFDANQKATPVHGEFTPGLGTSTFLDGAPAPRAVANDEYLNPPNALGGGLGRKKSLVQRLRKNSGSENTSRRASNDNQIEHTYLDDPIEPSGNSLLRRVKSLKVGRK